MVIYKYLFSLRIFRSSELSVLMQACEQKKKRCSQQGEIGQRKSMRGGGGGLHKGRVRKENEKGRRLGG